MSELQRHVQEQVHLLTHTHFSELAGSPEKLGQLVEMSVAGSNGVSAVSDAEFKQQLKRNPDLRAQNLATIALMSLFDEAGQYAGQREGAPDARMSLEQMREVQGKIVNLFYGIARHAAAHPQPMHPSHAYLAINAACLSDHTLPLSSRASALFHTAAYSNDPEVAAKATFIELVTQTVDAYQQIRGDLFVSRQTAVRENHPVARMFIGRMEEGRSGTVRETEATAAALRRRLVQKRADVPDDSFYLEPSVTPDESRLLGYNPRLWYDYLHFYSSFSQAGSIPLTFPDGHFKGIGHEDGDNGPRTQRVLATAWNTPLAEEVSDPRAITDVMTHLVPLDKTTVQDPRAIEASATVNTAAAGQLLETGSVPVRVQIGANSLALQIGEDGGLYLKNGESVGITGPAGEAWFAHIAASLRPSLFAFLREHRTQLSPALIPLLLRQMRPELMGVSFIELERDLKQIRETLSAPKRGLLRDGLTVKFTKGQLPVETPVTSIHYDRSGSRAAVSIGNTKLEVGIDFTVPPPKVVSVNGAPFAQEGNENTWFEYVVLSPLKALVCPDPRIKPEENDEVILEDAQNLPLRQAIEKTIKVIHQKVGHLYLLPERNGKPTKYTEVQAAKVEGLTYPLIGVKKLYLEDYNLDPAHRPDQVNGRYWDYAVYAEETYDRHQPVKHATVTTPHAFDGFYRIRASEERARSSGAGIVE